MVPPNSPPSSSPELPSNPPRSSSSDDEATVFPDADGDHIEATAFPDADGDHIEATAFPDADGDRFEATAFPDADGDRIQDPWAGTPPPAALKERTRAALVRGGHLSRPRRWARFAPRAAAVAALLVLAFFGGRRSVNVTVLPDDEGDRRWLLLVMDDPARPESAPGPTNEDYVRWSDELRAEGRFVVAEPLERTAAVVGGGERLAERAASVTGFFLVRASDESEAIGIARGSPHVRFGGGIVIRPIASSAR